jgi:hypothetical protein
VQRCAPHAIWPETMADCEARGTTRVCDEAIAAQVFSLLLVLRKHLCPLPVPPLSAHFHWEWATDYYKTLAPTWMINPSRWF